MRMGFTLGFSATPSTPAEYPTSSTPIAMGSNLGFTPKHPPHPAGYSMRSATPVPTGSNLGNPKQPKPGSASIVTATLGDRQRSPNVADLRGSDKQRRKVRQAAASAAPAQSFISTGSGKKVGGPNTGRLDENGDKGSETTPAGSSALEGKGS
ncbi:hypothetical protein JTB14_036543 [Gonioctena quinquepunctata]|nr:hypothetical protein JTB14_036543 [Gonioctena quinquepunctata]